jgi:hypothetical protein
MKGQGSMKFLCLMKMQLLRFIQGDSIREVRAVVAALKKVKGEEVLRTLDGMEIPVRDVISVNGIQLGV